MRFFRFLGRGLVVNLLFLYHLVVWLVGWLVLLLAFRPRARRQSWFGRRLTALLVGLGATFIKVGQIMSTRPDLFPRHVIDALEKLQDDVGAFSLARVERTFVEEFGRPPADIFDSFEPVPIASASVAQVHRAVLDGVEVAVKVRRPRLEDIVVFDLRMMRLVARVISIVPTIRLFAPVENVEEFGRAIRMQIDLTIEAGNNQRFHANFADDPDVDFPELISEYCSTRVLTMRFVHGVKVLEYRRTGADPVRLAKIGFRTLLQMVFADGFVHADLHPGNIFVTETGKVTILDLGLTAELDESHRLAFARFFAAWAGRDGVAMAKILFEFSPSPVIERYPEFEAEVVAFVERYYGKELSEVQISTVAFDMFNILRRHRVRVNPTFTMCNIAIAVTEGIGKQLAPQLDLVKETLPFFAQLQMMKKL